MVLCEWCQLWDDSAFVLKQALDWRVEHVSRWGALPYLAYTGQVFAAEHKVLSTKQGSKILIIYFTILIVNLLKSVVHSVFLGWKP